MMAMLTKLAELLAALPELPSRGFVEPPRELKWAAISGGGGRQLVLAVGPEKRNEINAIDARYTASALGAYSFTCSPTLQQVKPVGLK
jgi:hypothetical protein